MQSARASETQPTETAPAGRRWRVSSRAGSSKVALGAAVVFIASAMMLGLRPDGVVVPGAAGWTLRGTLAPKSLPSPSL